MNNAETWCFASTVMVADFALVVTTARILPQDERTRQGEGGWYACGAAPHSARIPRVSKQNPIAPPASKPSAKAAAAASAARATAHPPSLTLEWLLDDIGKVGV